MMDAARHITRFIPARASPAGAHAWIEVRLEL